MCVYIPPYLHAHVHMKEHMRVHIVIHVSVSLTQKPQNGYEGHEALFSAWWERARRQLRNLIAWSVWPLLLCGLCLLCNCIYTGS